MVAGGRCCYAKVVLRDRVHVAIYHSSVHFNCEPSLPRQGTACMVDKTKFYLFYLHES